jgi:hypothetical protein
MKSPSSCDSSEASQSSDDSNTTDSYESAALDVKSSFSNVIKTPDKKKTVYFDDDKKDERTLVLNMSALERDYHIEEKLNKDTSITAQVNSQSPTIEEGQSSSSEQKCDILPLQSTDLDSVTLSHSSSRQAFYRTKKFYASIVLLITSILMVTLGLIVFQIITEQRVQKLLKMRRIPLILPPP